MSGVVISAQRTAVPFENFPCDVISPAAEPVGKNAVTATLAKSVGPVPGETKRRLPRKFIREPHQARLSASAPAFVSASASQPEPDDGRLHAAKRSSLSRASVRLTPDHLAAHQQARLEKRALKAEVKRLPPFEAAKRKIEEWTRGQEREFQQKAETGKYAPGAAKRAGYGVHAALFPGRDVGVATSASGLLEFSPFSLPANIGVGLDAYFASAAYLQYLEIRGKLRGTAEAAEQRLQQKQLELKALEGNADAIALLRTLAPQAAEKIEAILLLQDRHQAEETLREDIRDAAKDLNDAAAACKTEDAKQTVEVAKLLRDLPLQAASGAASAANSLEYLSRALDLTAIVVDTAATIPVIALLGIASGAMDQVHGRADYAAAKNDLKAARIKYLDRMEALHRAGEAETGRDNTRCNVAQCAFKQITRGLDAALRRKRTNAWRQPKGGVIAGTAALTLILAPLDPTMTAVPSAVSAVNSTAWWIGVATNAAFGKASKERAQDRQRDAIKYLDLHSTEALRKLFRDNHLPLAKKGNPFRRGVQFLLDVIEGAPSALRDVQPVGNDMNRHHNAYLACELLARGMAEEEFIADAQGNMTRNKHRNNAAIMLKEDLRLTDDALQQAADMIEVFCAEKLEKGEYTLEDRIAHWRVFVAGVMKLKLFSPESLKAGEQSPQDKARILFGREFFRQYGIEVPKSAGEVFALESKNATPLLVAAAGQYRDAPAEKREEVLRNTLLSLSNMGFDTDDFLPMLEYMAAHCMEDSSTQKTQPDIQKLEALSASPECELIRALMEHVYRPHLGGAEAFDSLAESGEKNNKLSTLLEAIQHTAGKISAFNKEASQPDHVLDLTLDCINIFRDLGEAGIHLGGLETMMAALENAEGMGNHRAGKRTALMKSIRILQQFDTWQKNLNDRKTLDALVPIARARKHAERYYGKEPAPWELGRDGSELRQRVRRKSRDMMSRAAAFFVESPRSHDMHSAETARRWLDMRRALEKDGIDSESLHTAARKLNSQLEADPDAGSKASAAAKNGPARHQAAIWKNGSMAEGLLCPPRDSRVILKAIDAAGGLRAEAELARFAQLKPGTDEVQVAFGRLAEAGINREQLKEVLSNQAALPDYARLPGHWVACLQLLEAAAKVPRGLVEFKLAIAQAIGSTEENPLSDFNTLQPDDKRVQDVLSKLARAGIDQDLLNTVKSSQETAGLSPDWQDCLALLFAASRTPQDLSRAESAIREAMQLSNLDLIAFHSLAPGDERVKIVLRNLLRNGLNHDQLQSILVKQRAFPGSVEYSPGLLKSIELLLKASADSAGSKFQRRAAAAEQIHLSMQACFPDFAVHLGPHQNDLARVLDKGNPFERQMAAAQVLSHAKKAGITDSELTGALIQLSQGEQKVKGVSRPLAHQFGGHVFAELWTAHRALVNDPERFDMLCRAHDVRDAIRHATKSVAKFNKLEPAAALPAAAVAVSARLLSQTPIGSDGIHALQQWLHRHYPAADPGSKAALGDWHRVSRAIDNLRAGLEINAIYNTASTATIDEGAAVTSETGQGTASRDISPAAESTLAVTIDSATEPPQSFALEKGGFPALPPGANSRLKYRPSRQSIRSIFPSSAELPTEIQLIPGAA